jgi:dienelactone hydrolase
MATSIAVKFKSMVLAICGLVFTGAVHAAEVGKAVDYSVGGEIFEGYYAAAANKDAPVIYVVHDWDGLTEYEVKRAEMLVELGYSVFLADLFGKGVRPTSVKDKRQHTGELYKDREKMRAIMNAGLAKAKELGGNTDQAIAVGYCFGGAAILELARSGAGLKGFVSLHGGLSTPEGQNYESVKAPVLVLHGTADKNIPMSVFAGLAEEMEAAKAPHEMISYGGADHAFTVFGGNRYHEEADSKSWARMTQFIKEVTP